MRMVLGSILPLLFMPGAVTAQSLAERVARVGTGTVHLSFAARPGVCGDGSRNIQVNEADDEWEEDCEPQPVRVALKVEGGQVTAVKSYVGGHWRRGGSATDLGRVRPQHAAPYFISLVERGSSLSGDPILAATL